MRRTSDAPKPGEVHPELKATVERIKRMTPDEMFEASVRAGIYTPDGELTPPYRGALDEEAAEASG